MVSKLKVISYSEIRDEIDGSKAHLLLGNGFSRAWKNETFAYQALFEQAKNAGLPSGVLQAFSALQTTDFEEVMRALRVAAKLVDSYLNKKSILGKKLRADAQKLRDILVKTIAGNHPARPADVSPKAYAACRSFLADFENIYTLNYDLLLYWTLMQKEIDPSILADDGFRQPVDGPATYVSWSVENTNSQNIHYLHGALHLFDAGHELQKFTWVNTGIALIDQIREALEADKYPLFVSEGTSNSKLARIQHSGYLNRGYRSFAAIGHALVVFGHSMAENDEHIVRLIEKNKVNVLAVGLHGDPGSKANQRIVQRTEKLMSSRPPQRPLAVRYFDSESAAVWG